MFDNRKATISHSLQYQTMSSNCRQKCDKTLLDILCQHIGVRNQTGPAGGTWW